MKEIKIIGTRMALEHASFQLFKNIRFKIGIVTPNFQLHDKIHQELILNIQAINNSSLDRVRKHHIQLSNGSEVVFGNQTRGSDLFRGYRFNMAFYMNDPLPHEIKMALILCLADNQSIIYTVENMYRGQL